MKIRPAIRFFTELGALATVFTAFTATAQTFTYDADTVTSGAQDGAGAGWNTLNSNFWNGAADVLWPNTTANVAIFGAGSGAAGSVTVGTVTANGITFNAPGSGNYTLTGGMITVGGTTPTIAFTPSATINSQLSGSSGLTVSAASATPTLTLGGNNNYTGITTVTRGNLLVTNANSLGATGAGNQTVITGNDVSGSTSLVLGTTAGLTISENLVFNGTAAGRARLSNNSAQNHILSGPIDVSSTGSLVQFTSDGTGSITVTGDITGTMSGGSLLFLRGGGTNASNRLLGSVNLTGGNLAKTDGGLWIVGAAGKTYSWAATQLSVGTLRMGVSNVLPSGVATTIGQDDNQSGTLDLNGTNQTTTGITFNYATNAVTSTGQITTGTGTLTLNGNLTYNTVNAYTGTGGLISGNLNLGGATRTFTINDSTGTSTEMTVSANISNGGLTKIGLGTLHLTGTSNAFAGNVTVNVGDVRITNSSGLGAGTKTITIVPTTNPTSVPSLVLDGSGGSIDLPSTFSFTTSFDALSGVLPISGEGAVINQAGNNTIAGNFSLTSGGGGTTFLSNAGKLTLSGNIAVVATAGSARTVFLRGAGDGEISGNISNGSFANSVNKDTGTGTWILSGANTYTGTTTVGAGTLRVNGSIIPSAGTGTVAVNNGGTLGGTGTLGSSINNVAVTVASGGRLSPGNGPGAMTHVGNLTLSSGALFDVDLAVGGVAAAGNGTTGTDRWNVTGSVTLTNSILTGLSGATSNNLFRGSYTVDNLLWLIVNSGAPTTTGTFSNARPGPGFTSLFGTQPSVVSVSGRNFAVFYNAQFTAGAFTSSMLTGGNDVLLIAIPEPSRLLLGLLALLPLATRRQRR